MQTGQYRRSLAFAAHVAGEHADVPAAAVLYAWLLRAGGQIEVSARILAEALSRSPTDAVALTATRAFASPVPAAVDALLDSPHRTAPFALDPIGGPAPSAQARVVAAGVLIEQGGFALVPAASITPGPARIWVRNGLGQTREAEVDAASTASAPAGVAVLRLRLPILDDLSLADRDPFAGSPGFAFAYPQGIAATPQWPQLRVGFFGAIRGSDGKRPLGIDIGRGQQGGVVLDAQGRLAGMVLVGDDGEALLLPVSRWPRLSELRAATPTPASDPAARPRLAIPTEEAYERALRAALQVIVQR